MRSLVLEDTRRLVWQEVPEPRREREREAIVRPLAVATCDLDQPMIFGRTPFPFPIHLGHECVAEVVEGPEGFEPGERVVVPFQISCGTCERCRRGLTGSCTTVRPLSMYGFGALGGEWGGMLSDLALVPYADAMLVPLPEGVDPAVVASAADNIPDGWRAVAPALADLPAADVLVVGGGGGRSIPLYAVDAAVALGAASVTYVDTDGDRLRVAEGLGARAVEGPPERSLGRFPVTVDGTGTPDGLVATLRLTDWGGRCTSIGQLEPEAPLPLFELYTRGVELHIGRAMARPAIPPILDLVAAGRLRPQLVTSATAAWDDAPEALLEPTTKLVISRS
ncbi:MAG TPA: alcohol dehydrogenase catalytic domain-containing protein [Solirubrobacteraceae bacterium]|nr:alcohol dehydrogenase catalytic domain-containing protein [Solirubrobacteraceae bacterium]